MAMRNWLILHLLPLFSIHESLSHGSILLTVCTMTLWLLNEVLFYLPDLFSWSFWRSGITEFALAASIFYEGNSFMRRASIRFFSYRLYFMKLIGTEHSWANFICDEWKIKDEIWRLLRKLRTIYFHLSNTELYFYSYEEILLFNYLRIHSNNII